MGIKYLALHVHSDQSIKDGAQTPKEIVSRVKELGGPAVTLTDHGVLTGIFEFMKECKNNGIKGIPGVEAYVCEDGSTERRHLILLAKDVQGYRAIEKAVTESNKRIVELRTKSIPTMNKKILAQWFGEGSIGHDHVIATSACVQGIIASELTHNAVYEDIIRKKTALRDKYCSPNTPAYVEISRQLSDKLKEDVSLKEQIKTVKKEANAPTKKAENFMKKREGRLDYDDAKAAYDNLILKKALAAEQLDRLQSQQAVLKKEITKLKSEAKKYEDSFAKYDKYNQAVEEAKKNLLNPDILMSNAIKEAIYYKELFGENNFFMEIQFHGYQQEAYVFPLLVNIAKRIGLPLVPANDAHYTRKEDVRKRAMIVADSFKQVLEKIEPAECELYIKTDDELKDCLLAIISEKDVDSAFENLKYIADVCNVDIPFEAHYPVFKGLPEGETDSTYIRKLAIAGIEKRYPNGVAPDGTMWDQEHIDRMESELAMIDRMGYNHYHLVVQDYLNYGRKLGFDCPEGVGYTIGPGRGSAVGSLVCYLLGITDLDPIKYNLFFERYLNPERVSMPDIDADFANCIRDKVIEYEKSIYGDEGVCGVTTKGTLKIKAAILLAGRVNPETHNEISRVRRITKAVPKGAQHFDDYIDPCDKKKGTVKDFLLKTFENLHVETQIINDAASIEGLTVSFGRHAAAVILSDTGDVSDQVALMYTKGNWAVQCVKEEAEANAGLLKMDFLGLINLDIITETLRKVYRNHHIRIDMSKDVKFEDEVFRNIFSTGNTDAVFQFSSEGMKQMLRDFMPSSFEDLILLVSAYRPGPMQYLADIIAVKHGDKKMTYSIPELSPILSGTYGKTVYQEQVQEIFKKLAGYSLGQADIVRRAMSKKKFKELEKEREAFLHGDTERNIKGCVANGINESAANKLFDEMMDFASYAFNKSHAAAYAYVAYQTAWFKYHYPTEYMASVMENSKYEKIPMYIFNAKNMGLKIALPDINNSTMGFSANDGVIQFGFKAMKGVGNNDAEEILEERKKGDFKSFKNFIKRTNVTKATFENLVYGGAFDCFNGNRKALFDYGERLRELKKKISDAKQKFEKTQSALNPESTVKEIAKVKTLEDNYISLSDEMGNIIIHSGYEDKIGKLTREKEILGSFISDHPINSYKLNDEATKIKDIAKVLENNNSQDKSITLCGLVTDFRILRTKKDGREFCAFTFDDGTGLIDVTVFPNQYDGIIQSGGIHENDVISITGQVKKEEIQIKSSDDVDEVGETDYVYKFFGHSLGDGLKKKQCSVILNLTVAAEWAIIGSEILKEYESSTGEGLNLLINDETNHETRNTGKIVKPSILQNKQYKITKSNVIM